MTRRLRRSRAAQFKRRRRRRRQKIRRVCGRAPLLPPRRRALLPSRRCRARRRRSGSRTRLQMSMRCTRAARAAEAVPPRRRRPIPHRCARRAITTHTGVCLWIASCIAVRRRIGSCTSAHQAGTWTVRRAVRANVSHTCCTRFHLHAGRRCRSVRASVTSVCHLCCTATPSRALCDQRVQAACAWSANRCRCGPRCRR